MGMKIDTENLQAMIGGDGERLHLQWLAALPGDDPLAALAMLAAHLRDIAAHGRAADAASARALYRADQRCRDSLAALVGRYVAAASLPAEEDDRLWHAVLDAHRALETAYQAWLERHLGQGAAPAAPDDAAQVLLNLVDINACAARWRYMRYLSMAEGGWRRLHELYRTAERLGCVQQPLRRHPDQPATTIAAAYLRALMLDTLNHTSMLKPEIAMVAQWLALWCRNTALDASYDAGRHLFFVNLDEDRGGRRMRHLQGVPHGRYWDADGIVARVEGLRLELQQGRMPAELPLAEGVTLADCDLLAGHMLAEWSRAHYQRQRRQEERAVVAKDALVVHGLPNISQHVKNAAYSRLMLKPVAAGEEPSPDEAAALAAEGWDPAASDAVRWAIRNESTYGFGATVNADMNLWLHPGKLIAIDYEMNHDLPILGVVRSVQQPAEHLRDVGIEVLSHTPVYVSLRPLFSEWDAQDFMPADVFLEIARQAQHVPAFPALYLPRDEARQKTSAMILPQAEFMTAGFFEFRAGTRHGQVRLEHVIEQRDGWALVEVSVQE